MNKKVFIDCGGHKGESVRKAREIYGDVVCYSFECNPELWKFYDDSTMLMKYAVSDHDGEEPFYLGKSLGSTMFKNKKTGRIDYEKPITVKTIDLSAWCNLNLSHEDYNILKLNVEGAEVPVLYKMITDRTLSLFDEVYCNFHYNRFKGGDKKIDIGLAKEILEKYHLTLKPWRP